MFGNLQTINASQCTASTLNLSVNNANQVTNPGFSYDTVGNLLTDGVYTYTWDAEGRLTAANGMTYSYGGDGARLAKSPSGPLYWYGLGGEVLAETDTSGNTTNEYIYFGGMRIARRDASANVFYYFGDHLGTPRKITNSTGTVCYDADFYPFGGERVFTNTCAQNYKLAAMERDTETGQDHTWFRQYSSNFGRWLSPDPLEGDPENPQSWNRYAYVGNNPASGTDPLGLGSCRLTGDSGDKAVDRIDAMDARNQARLEGFGLNTNPGDPCAYAGNVDVECTQLPGLFPNGLPIYAPVYPGGGVGGGGRGGSFPSGDFGPIRPLGIGDLLGFPTDPSCEFGGCGGAVPVPDSGFAEVAKLGAEIGTEIEPGIGTVVGIVVGLAIDGYLAYRLYRASKAKENVAHTGIMEEAQKLIQQGKAADVCGALDLLMGAAKQAGDTAKQLKIKATQKDKGCRPSRQSR